MKDDEVDLKAILNFLKKLTIKDMIIFYIIILFLLFFMFHTYEIERCQTHYNKLLNDKDFLRDVIGRLTYGYGYGINLNNTLIDIPTDKLR